MRNRKSLTLCNGRPLRYFSLSCMVQTPPFPRPPHGCLSALPHASPNARCCNLRCTPSTQDKEKVRSEICKHGHLQRVHVLKCADTVHRQKSWYAIVKGHLQWRHRHMVVSCSLLHQSSPSIHTFSKYMFLIFRSICSIHILHNLKFVIMLSAIKWKPRPSWFFMFMHSCLF